MSTHSKRRWGSWPGKEGGGKASFSEEAYIRQCNAATAAGRLAAQDPRAAESWCPGNYNEDQASYWLTAFRRERRRPS